MQQPGWYRPHALFWHQPPSHCCWWVRFVGPLELRFGRIWVQEIVVRLITRWGMPLWDCTRRLWRSPMLSGLLHQGAYWKIPPASSSLILCTLFETGLGWSVIVHSIMTFFSTVVANDVIQISPGFFILLFYVAFVVPSFPALRKHWLVPGPIWLGVSIIVIIRLIV